MTQNKQFYAMLFYFMLLSALIGCVHYPEKNIENDEREEIDYSKTDSVKISDTVSVQ